MADTHEGMLPVPCDRAIAIINLIGVGQVAVRAGAACQQGKAQQHNRQQTEEPFHVFHIVLHQIMFYQGFSRVSPVELI